MSAPELGEQFINSPLMYADAAAFNQDERGVKSGEVIANLLTKRLPNLQVFRSPADAIERHPTGRVVMVEDGLWSGTEAIGVFDSLLGDAKDAKNESAVGTRSLSDSELTLVYGIGTDYGQAMVRRYLADEGLSNIQIFVGASCRWRPKGCWKA